jgi:hypothetical protein
LLIGLQTVLSPGRGGRGGTFCNDVAVLYRLEMEYVLLKLLFDTMLDWKTLKGSGRILKSAAEKIVNWLIEFNKLVRNMGFKRTEYWKTF